MLEQVLNELIQKYGISDEDVARLEEALGYVEEAEVVEEEAE